MSSPNVPNAVQVHAAGEVTGVGGVLGPGSVNIVSVSRTAAGIYVVTLGTAIAVRDRTIQATLRNTIGLIFLDAETDTTFEVRTTNTVFALADRDFYFEVKRHGAAA